MEPSNFEFGLVIVGVIVAFVVYQSFFNKSDVVELMARDNGVELDLRKKKADLVKQARSSFQQK